MRLGLLFPGQGSQRPGMGRGLEALLRPWEAATGLPLIRWTTQSDEAELRATDVAQPAIAAVSLALWSQLGPQPTVAVAGHSLGEFSALAACGALQPEDVLRLVAARGKAMAKAPLGSMAAVMGLDPDTVRRTLLDLGETVVVANLNGPGQVVIAGSLPGIERADLALKQAGARRVIRLSVGGAFHSPLMSGAFTELREALALVSFGDARLPLVANVDAQPTREAQQWPDKLGRQLTSPVLWQAVIERMQQLGVTHWLEIGPGQVLTPLVRRILPDAKCEAVSTLEEVTRWRS